MYGFFPFINIKKIDLERSTNACIIFVFRMLQIKLV